MEFTPEYELNKSKLRDILDKEQLTQEDKDLLYAGLDLEEEEKRKKKKEKRKKKKEKRKKIPANTFKLSNFGSCNINKLLFHSLWCIRNRIRIIFPL